MSKPYRIIFMGSPDFAIPTLEALCESPYEVVAVYAQAPKPADRGQQLKKCAVHTFALSKHLPVETPVNFKSDEAIKKFQSYQADIAIVAAYGLILPKVILDAPQYGCVNIHGSLLPKWRGAAPIQYAILNGDVETGVTLMKMNEGMDTGDMILKASFPIHTRMTASDCFKKIAHLGAEKLSELLPNLEDMLNNAVPQNNDQASYAPKLKKEDGHVFWQDAQKIDAQFRALTPWPGTFFEVNGERVKITHLELSDKKHPGNAGEILDALGLIQCELGQVKLITIQPQNKKPMGFKDFLNGRNDLKIGELLG